MEQETIAPVMEQPGMHCTNIRCTKSETIRPDRRSTYLPDGGMKWSCKTGRIKAAR